MKSFKEFIEEATKEMTLKQVMKKIDDGYWEAEQDMKVGRHAILRDIKTKKRITVYIKEDLNEATKSIDIPADVYRASLGHDPKKWKKWYTANGFSVDSKTNRLSKDNNLWKIDTATKSLVIMNESELDEATKLDEISEAEDVHNFISDMIMDFEKKLESVISKGSKSIDPAVLKDLKKLEAECGRVRKGKLHDVRSGR